MGNYHGHEELASISQDKHLKNVCVWGGGGEAQTCLRKNFLLTLRVNILKSKKKDNALKLM